MRWKTDSLPCPGCCDTGHIPTCAQRRRILRGDGQVKLRGGVAVTQDDLLYRFRPRVFPIAAEFGTVRATCRAMGIHPSTYCRWKRQLDRRARRSWRKALPQRATAED